MRFGRTGQAKTYLSRADRLEQQQSRIERVRAQAQDAPGEPERWRKLGRVLRQAGRLEEAREAFSVALYLRPQDSTLRNEVAKLASDLGNYEAAISHYRTLLHQRPSYVRGWFNLGVVYSRKGGQEGRKGVANGAGVRTRPPEGQEVPFKFAHRVTRPLMRRKTWTEVGSCGELCLALSLHLPPELPGLCGGCPFLGP